MSRYTDAAAPLYAVLAVGPGWDWGTFISLYPSVSVYTDQLRALESYCNTNAGSVPARFVLAYLYMTQGKHDATICRAAETRRCPSAEGHDLDAAHQAARPDVFASPRECARPTTGAGGWSRPTDPDIRDRPRGPVRGSVERTPR